LARIQQRFLILDYPGGEPCSQALPVRRFTGSLIDLKAKLEFIASLVVQSNKECIGAEQRGYLAIYCFHQGVQLQCLANRSGDPVDHQQSGFPFPQRIEQLAGNHTVSDQRNTNGVGNRKYGKRKLEDAAGNQFWAAVPSAKLEIGEKVVLKDGTVMRNFTSKTLNRTFETILFAAAAVRQSEGTGEPPSRASAAPAGMADQMSTGSARAIAPFAGSKVEKSTAQNAYTVGELFEKAVELDQQKVTVKGQVVKVSPNIMGKNWIHIQDGTGDPATNTHDLVVTSAVLAERGAVVSLEGVVAAGKDFGFGYRYDVIIEDAVVVE